MFEIEDKLEFVQLKSWGGFSMMVREFVFPAVPEAKTVNQFSKVREELDEIEAATNDDNLVEEYWDALHALEQIGRRIEKRVGHSSFWVGAVLVQAKNVMRNLYQDNLPNLKEEKSC